MVEEIILYFIHTFHFPFPGTYAILDCNRQSSSRRNMFPKNIELIFNLSHSKIELTYRITDGDKGSYYYHKI